METVKVAIIGFGTIGSGIAEVLEKQKKLITSRTGKTFELSKILDIRDFSVHPLKDRFVRTIDEITIDDSISVVAEAIGGVMPAFEYVMKCIAAGKHVVTSNKELVATKGHEIFKAAQQHGVGFLFEAAVGGTMPIISSMTGVLSANSIERIDGILNGTTNFILTNMFRKKLSFEEALSRAQQLGYAETKDPSDDVDGIDAGRKIAILASIAYGSQFPVEKVHMVGIRNVSYEDLQLADLAGGAIKLIASAEGKEFGDVRASVLPTFVPKENRFASVDDVFNMASLKCSMSGTVEVHGRGAGKLPTAAVVVGDIIELSVKTSSRPALWTAPVQNPDKSGEIRTRYFMTAYAKDEAGFAKLGGQIEVACSIEGASGLFTAEILRGEEGKLSRSLSKMGIDVKFFPVLKD